MARKPDLPCAACGRLLWRSSSSLPEGDATCQPCRRARGGGSTYTPVRPWEDRTCPRCLVTFRQGNCTQVYCSPACRGRRNKKRSTNERGYDKAHRELRALLLPTAYGTPCHLCGDAMLKGQDLHLDHTPDRTGYRGFAHAWCNTADGARRGGMATRRKKLERAGLTDRLG